MPDLTISELKRALVEVKRICKERESCVDCPFSNPYSRTVSCKLCDLFLVSRVPPMDWDIDGWKEDEHAQTD